MVSKHPPKAVSPINTETIWTMSESHVILDLYPGSSLDLNPIGDLWTNKICELKLWSTQSTD